MGDWHPAQRCRAQRVSVLRKQRKRGHYTPLPSICISNLCTSLCNKMNEVSILPGCMTTLPSLLWTDLDINLSELTRTLQQVGNQNEEVCIFTSITLVQACSKITSALLQYPGISLIECRPYRSQSCPSSLRVSTFPCKFPAKKHNACCLSKFPPWRTLS